MIILFKRLLKIYSYTSLNSKDVTLEMRSFWKLKAKFSRLKKPGGFACVPILVRLGGVTDLVATSGFFYRIIDIADFLEVSNP